MRGPFAIEIKQETLSTDFLVCCSESAQIYAIRQSNFDAIEAVDLETGKNLVLLSPEEAKADV